MFHTTIHLMDSMAQPAFNASDTKCLPSPSACIKCCGATRTPIGPRNLRMTINNSTLLLPADEVGFYWLFQSVSYTCYPCKVVANCIT
jgi:hypothetical protein